MSAIERFYINDEAGFQALESDWNSLATRTDPGSVFLRHEWFDAASCWLKSTSDLCIVCIRRDNELIGICPLVRRRSTNWGVGVTELQFLAVPDTQECAFLSDPADADLVAESLLDCLYSRDVRWDVLRLEKLRADSATYRAIEAAASRVGREFQVLDGGINPGISFDGSWSSYYGRRSKRLRKGNNLIANRLTRAGKQAQINCYGHDTLSEFEFVSLMKTLVGLSKASWKATTGLTLENPGPAAFFARLSEHAIRNGWFRAWVLSIDGEPAAMEYQLEFKGTVYGLRADYDQRFTDSSPGSLLNWRIIERLFDGGVKYYAMGPGSNAYKMRWAEEELQLKTLLHFKASARGRIAAVMEKFIRPIAVRMLKWIKRKN